MIQFLFRTNRFWQMAAAATALLLMAGGCSDNDGAETGAGRGGNSSTTIKNGGSNSESSQSETAVEIGSLSKAEFIEQANKICRKDRRRFERRLKKMIELGGKADLNAEARALVDGLVSPIYKKQITKIGALGAPKGDKAEIVSFLEALQRGLDEAGARPLKFVRSGGASFAEAIEIADSYGLIACADGLGADPRRKS